MGVVFAGLDIKQHIIHMGMYTKETRLVKLD